jgi:two-component system, LytTR family, response regulator LytT
MRILIIEDEILTAKDLAKTITAIDDDATIAATLGSIEESIAYLNEHASGIDLIFSDIQLGDGLSFEIFEKTNNHIPVIFCTAYNDYALNAFQTVGIDYVLKPFSKESISKALEKFSHLKEKLTPPREDAGTLMSLLKAHLSPSKLPSVIIQQGDKIIPLEGDKIAFFFVEDEQVFAFGFDQKKYPLSQKLDGLEKTFAPLFFRANRQFLVNRKAVKDASHFFNRKVVVNLSISFPERIIVGKLKVTAFVDWLANQ